jgi:hypothetical protein
MLLSAVVWPLYKKQTFSERQIWVSFTVEEKFAGETLTELNLTVVDNEVWCAWFLWYANGRWH